MEKGKLLVSIVLFIMVLSLIRTNPSVSAHLESPIDSGWAQTPPIIDGNMTAGEWANATVRDFALNMTSRTTGVLNRTLQGRFYVENNWTYIFLAVQIFNDDYEAKDAGGQFDGLFMLFDNNNDGNVVLGENGEGMQAWNLSAYYSNNDLYYDGDSSWLPDTTDGRNNDGAMKWSHTNQTQGAIGNWTFEMMIPLIGSDDYDFNITSLPKTVGFKIWLQEPRKGFDGVYPDDPTIAKSIDEVVPTNGNTFGDITFYPLYNLTMIATTGGTTNPTPGVHQYPYKTVVNATATADPWYQFDHWELDSINVGAANPYSVTMDQNHTLKAIFDPLYALTITTTAGGTTNPALSTYVYLNGTVVNVTATANGGYDFDHWELDSVDVGTINPYHVLMNQNHTLNAVFVKQLLVSISPSDTTIILGNSVTFSSNVTGGTTPYSYQWYLGTSKVLGATSGSWVFTPTSTGIYFVYLNVTDYRSRVAISNTARVVVISVPMGGYAVPLEKAASTPQIVCFGAVLAGFGAAISIIRRKKR
jgi:hypothetical protein